MAKGHKTEACAVVASATFLPALMDPTGATLMIFLSAGTGLMMGGTYHAARKTLKWTKEQMEDHRAHKAQQNSLGMSPSGHIQFQSEVELTVRRLAAAVGGTTINGVLFVKMPISGMAFMFNVKEVSEQAKKLKGLAGRAGGYRQLVSNVSLKNIVAQAATGVAIKALTTFFFIGDEFHDFMEGLSHMADVLTDHPIPTVDVLTTKYDQAISHGPLSFTTEAASAPVNAMKEHFRLEPSNWSWTDHHSLESVLAVGATVAAVDKVVDVAAEGPLHAAANKANGFRKRRV